MWAVVMLIIGTFATPNINGIVISSRENWASVANYVQWIVRLKKIDLEAAKYVGVLP